MKTKTYILVILLAFSFSILTAGEFSKVKSSLVTEMNPVNELNRLAPFTPLEASFDEEVMGYLPVSLYPYAPEFADFSDVLPEPASPSVNIAPEVPIEATFEDEPSTEVVPVEILNNLAPSTPQEAPFEDM